MTRPIRVAQCGLIAAGILALGYCALVYFDGWLFQVREKRRFEQKLVEHPAVPKASPEPGAVLGRLEIPRLGVSVMVVEGVRHRRPGGENHGIRTDLNMVGPRMAEGIGQGLAANPVNLVTKQWIERFLPAFHNHAEFDRPFVRTLAAKLLLNLGEPGSTRA